MQQGGGVQFLAPLESDQMACPSTLALAWWPIFKFLKMVADSDHVSAIRSSKV